MGIRLVGRDYEVMNEQDPHSLYWYGMYLRGDIRARPVYLTKHQLDAADGRIGIPL